VPPPQQQQVGLACLVHNCQSLGVSKLLYKQQQQALRLPLWAAAECAKLRRGAGALGVLWCKC
jgi:hypothetical protein